MNSRRLPSVHADGRGPFSKHARVRRRWEFHHIHKNGVRVHTKAFSIIGCNGLGHGARLGLAVSKKVGNAVVRNRTRRIIREIFRRLIDDLPQVDIVVVAKPPLAILAARGLQTTAEVLVPAVEKCARRAARVRTS